VAIGEIYIKLSVTFANDPKVRMLARYGVDGILARDLYVQMICHCKEMLTDGLVQEEQLGLMVYPLDVEHGKQLAKQLASVGLITEEASGYRVLAYLKRNGSRADVEALSEKRAEAGRRGGEVSRKPARQDANQAKGKQVASGALKQNEARVRDRVSSTELPYGSSAANGSRPSHADFAKLAKPITDAYYAIQPMCKWTAVNGIVIHALKTGKYDDDQIRDALLRMAGNGQGVTIESLRVELEGFTPRGRHANAESTGAQRARAGVEAGEQVQAMIDGGTIP
jgi:hypothetical protein